MSATAAAAALLTEGIDPALALLAGWGLPVSAPARRLLLAIARQESGWTSRRQAGGGPARGAWQFERGGVVGVLTHPASATLAHRRREACGVLPVAPDVWAALEHDDVLAAGIARLLLRTDPQALPVDKGEGWRCYLRLWRPGKPRPESWPARWHSAGEVGNIFGNPARV